jgi:hypothetical protein
MRRLLSLLILLLLLLPAGCAAPPRHSGWKRADLRQLDPVDASGPEVDILAVYTRLARLSVEIRVDLLDLAPSDELRLQIRLTDHRNFAARPLVVSLPTRRDLPRSGRAARDPGARPRLARDYRLDTLIVRLDRARIGGRFRVDVFTFAGASASPADRALAIHSNGLPPGEAAPVLLAFWDAFPAATPAQALRRWDGAHTGPEGGRHGLKYLLQAADRHGLPIALLDLKNAAGLAALDHVGGTARLHDLQGRGLLILPDVATADPAGRSLNLSRRAAAGFGLAASPFVYAPAARGEPSRPLPGSRPQFVSLPDRAHLARSGGGRLIPLPAADEVEATEAGPAIPVRRALIEAALTPDPSDLVVLGGSLPNSTWGIPERVGPTLAWLAGHPWIRALDGRDLQTLPPSPAVLGPPISEPGSGETQGGLPPASAWFSALAAAPDDALTGLAWQSYLSLTARAAEPELRHLGAGYLGQLGGLLAAGAWARSPYRGEACSADLDLDGSPECILANDRFFAVIDPLAAGLTHLFYLDEAGPHQLIGPSSQFAVGLSDPSAWEPGGGVMADPSVLPGAFYEGPRDSPGYEPAIAPGAITLTQPAAGSIKAYRLSGTGLEVAYQAPGAVTTRIPLAVDPQAFYLGPTRYEGVLAPGSWSWGLSGGIRVEVRADAALAAQGFTASLPFMTYSEDPDLNYPAGHYYPFPLSVVEVSGKTVFHVWITVR